MINSRYSKEMEKVKVIIGSENFKEEGFSPSALGCSDTCTCRAISYPAPRPPSSSLSSCPSSTGCALFAPAAEESHPPRTAWASAAPPLFCDFNGCGVKAIERHAWRCRDWCQWRCVQTLKRRRWARRTLGREAVTFFFWKSRIVWERNFSW